MSLYISLDLETTGYNPEKHGILSIGAVAVSDRKWSIEGEFSVNLELPKNRLWDPHTAKWWEDPEQAQALVAVMKNQEDPGTACKLFYGWLNTLLKAEMMLEPTEQISFLAYPIAYDMPFLRSYMREYVGAPWVEFAETHKTGLGGVDLQTLAMAVLGRPYSAVRRKTWPEEWNPPDLPHTHVAIDDARHQAFAFVAMMQRLAKIREEAWMYRDLNK